jgi:hypothetical protein
MNYYWYEPTGRIIQGAYNITEEAALANPLSLTYALFESSVAIERVSRFYVVDESDELPELVEIPARPTKHHTWNWTTKVWEDVRTLLQRKEQAWARIKASRDAAEFGGFTWNTFTFDTDALSQSRMQGAAMAAYMAVQAGEAFSIEWTLSDNSSRTLTGPQMVQLGKLLNNHIKGVHATARSLRQQIVNATTAAQLDAIVWP